MTDGSPKVYIVDDEESVRRALARLLHFAGFDPVPFGSPGEFLAGHDAASPGCLVLDVAMPGLNGLELQHELATRGAERPIIFLTGRADIPMTVQAMKKGAVDFLTKPVDGESLLAAVRRALELDRVRRLERVEITALRQRWATLTPREREVLAGVAAGRLNKQIAADLGAAEKTIKIHRARGLEKMAVRSVADLVRLTERLGLPAASRPKVS